MLHFKWGFRDEDIYFLKLSNWCIGITLQKAKLHYHVGVWRKSASLGSGLSPSPTPLRQSFSVNGSHTRRATEQSFNEMSQPHWSYSTACK